MPNYAPELVESVLHDHEYTDKPLKQIAAEHGVSERDITRMRHANGIPSRRTRLRALPPEMREVHQITKRLKAARPAAADAEVAHNTQGEAGRIAGNDADEPSVPALIARVARLIEQELAAEEATRAKLGMFARTPVEAERCARILASMTRSLRELLRLRAALPPEQGSSNVDDDIPADADECRDELARRIVAFLEGREADGDAERTTGIAPVAR